MRTIAPAKINWTLEVLGRREDGYHEIRSVMQTIDLCDDVEILLSEKNSLEVEGDYTPDENDLALRAAQIANNWRFGIKLTKRIPVGSGLGGGSSDGAAVLRVIDRLVGSLDYDPTQRVDELGSDAPFFLYGGAALVKGRGNVIEEQSDFPDTWVVVMVPPITVADKTKRMYDAVAASESDKGWRSGAFMRLVKYRQPIDYDLLYNAFDGVADRVFPGIDEYRRRFLEAGGGAVHLCGAGPALFALTEGEAQASRLAERVNAPKAKVFVARTMTAREATRVTD